MYIRLPPWINFGISIKRSENTQMWSFWSFFDSYSQDLTKKIKSGTSHTTHHTSHIPYYIGICKFYIILVITTVVTLNNSSKLILRTFDKYFLMEIIKFTIQTPMSGLKLVKPTIYSKTRHFLKSSAVLKNLEKVIHMFFCFKQAKNKFSG